MTTWTPLCHTIRGLPGAPCARKAVGGLRHKAVVRHYCGECLDFWVGLYVDLEIEHEVVGLELATPPEEESADDTAEAPR